MCTECKPWSASKHLSSMCQVSFLAAPATDHQQVLSHLSSSLSLRHSPVLSYTIHIYPAMIHGAVADPLESHLPQVMSPKWSSPTTLSPEELKLTGFLGKICLNHKKELWEITIKTLSQKMDDFGKVGVEMSNVKSRIHSDGDSGQSTADSDLDDGEFRKMLASPMYTRARWKIEIILGDPWLQGNRKQTKQKRGGKCTTYSS